ncbi:DNA repair ATPase [Actinacidiphila glaucinigra]|uniref:ATPase family associated with various cellular activities (AAA) n=1 Tax=Actinacidiphila glaucinigra TaxID=235986 RepID=A0A239NGW6_9ACTN|nr:DNA repair ATPase [Actinacidiphila glaucinigra]SNT54020.1 ATPase family associated with various cellular activities (AAA) [Actinacidiphila glaucinigra]
MATEQPHGGLEAGTYKVLRTRLTGAARQLADRARALNDRRVETFGSGGLRPARSGHLRTADACVPRGVASVGGQVLLGHDTPASGGSAEDVFSLHDPAAFEAVGADTAPGLLDDPRFRQDLAELYRYYRDARLLQLRTAGDRLLAVFRTGPDLTDVRVLRWQVAADGTASYLDSRGERDHVPPPAYDMAWQEATRDDHVLGRHPHVSVQGEVFVSTAGGRLTIKAENDTSTPDGIHSEPVDEPLQSLADADIAHARAGALILLRVRPYNENAARYLIANTRTHQVTRLDGLGQACLTLPDDQGVIFPGGYCLDTGVVRTFDIPTDGLEFERIVRSPNGEDVLYVFHSRADGRAVLLPYNLIRKEVGSPLSCHGYALLDDGALVLLRVESAEPARVHPVQVWDSPYTTDSYALGRPGGAGPLDRVGNGDLVRGIADCLSVAGMVEEMAPNAAVYEAVAAACVRTADRHHWLAEDGLGALHEPLAEVRSTAEQVLGEFAAVTALTARAADALDEAATRITALVRRGRGETLGSASAWIRHLTELRQSQGHLASLRELRYVDGDRVDELSRGLGDDLAAAARRAVAFLVREDAFAGHHEDVAALAARAAAVATTAETAPLAGRLAEQTGALETVTEVVTGLDIADPVLRTSVLERIGAVLADVNRARATLDARRRELLGREGRAEFAAEAALLAHAVTAALGAANTPETCEEQLGRLLLRIEDLEARFGEYEDFTEALENRRTEIHDAFSTRRQALLDERARRADRLAESAGRILGSVSRRLATLASLDEVNTYFGSDPMVGRIRGVAGELRELGDPVRAEELIGRVKAARQQAARALRDRADLYDGGEAGSAVRLGRHRFAVTTQQAELTLVPYKGATAFALTGTDYRLPVHDPEFEATRPYWDQHLVSETPGIYRAEHLAACLLAETDPLETLYEADTAGRLLDLVREAAESRYDEGYERGIHDHDGAVILTALLRLRAEAGLLRYPAAARAAAQLFWAYGTDDASRDVWSARASSLAQARATFGLAPAVDTLRQELGRSVATFLDAAGLDLNGTELAGEYLFEELAAAADGKVSFVSGATARTLLEKFRAAADGQGPEAGLAALPDDFASLPARHQLAEAWLGSFLAAGGAQSTPGDLAEAVVLLLCDQLPRHECTAALTTTVDGLLGRHPRVLRGTLHLRLDEFIGRTTAHRTDRIPGFRAYQRLRADLLTRERTRLRLDDHRPQPPTTFVRNRLLDEVYLPLIGDNLAKQIGAADDPRRTDSSGLLLLVSPPGYGKTTLVEYVAERLGMLLVTVSGPALGSAVTSLDDDHPEIAKIHFALAAANNVLLYIDDIQHTSPELLQRFIPLTDAQRRLGPYDLRGKRFAVVMSGNPYTESGARFRIPDMLANRADVWNLGDVLTGRDELFALSFTENALTSNPVLAPLAEADRADLAILLSMARVDGSAPAEHLTRVFPPTELDRILSVLRLLLRAQRTVLAVNRAYIASAAQSDNSRTEPPFRLQGSYRNMNRLAERISPAMNDAELDALVDDHYRAEAQTLTSAAEANLLKLAEIRGTLTDAQAARWDEVKAASSHGRRDGDPLRSGRPV